MQEQISISSLVQTKQTFKDAFFFFKRENINCKASTAFNEAVRWGHFSSMQ